MINAVLKHQFMGGPYAVILYKNLDYFYIQEQGIELVTIYAKVFEDILSDNKVNCEVLRSVYDPHKWYLVFLNEGLPLEESQAFQHKDKTFSILAAYVLTDLYRYYTPYGLNPALYYITFNFYGWISIVYFSMV